MKRILLSIIFLLTFSSAFAKTERLPDGRFLKVEALSDNVVRVRVSTGEEFEESLMERYGLLKTDWRGAEMSEKARILLGRICFEAPGSPLAVSLCDTINRRFEGLETRRNSPIIGDDDGSISEKDKTEGGDPEKSSVVRIRLNEGERFYGGGSTSREHIQHRGEILRMWATYQRTEIPMPFLMSSEGWGVYNNSTRKSFFDVGCTEKDYLNIYTTDSEVDIYLFTGEDMPAVLDAYTLLTGRNYLLPKWAYGLCFGPNMREDQWDILSDAIRFREAGVPCDVFWLEPQWMSKHYDFSTSKSWNYDKFTPEYFFRQSRYPKMYYPDLFIGKLNTLGMHLGLWLCEEYDLSIAEEDALDGAAQSGQEHWMDHLKPFIDLGVEGFKLDPARTLDERLYFKYYNGKPDAQMHNLNQVLLPKQLNLLYREHTEKRGWQHYCGGWSGTQHWGASTSGDNGGGKTALFDQLNLGNSGYMNTSCDVMFVAAQEQMQSLHFGTFLPWLQINSWCSMMQPFYYGAKDLDIYRKCIRLRYDLMPYIYSMAIEGALTGMPMVRSMPLVFPEDRDVDDMWTQYMFGESLLVGIFTNEIYLPKGEWTDAWTGEKIVSGGETIHWDYPEDRAGLLFIKGGAIIPSSPEYDTIGLEPYSKLTVDVYPHGESSYVMYDCDSESYGYEAGLVAATRFECSLSAKTLKLAVHPVSGSFENMPESREWIFRIRTERKPSRVMINGKKHKDWTWFDGVLSVDAGKTHSNNKLDITVIL
ncbi:MAG: glycoside hydrolase family 31 protein [Bacteroidales bacterium]|nr:glycoside hydrolase family 31 protein [Bacteroidales bacterium]